MDTLRFLHQFFHISHSDRLRAWPETMPDWREAERIFRADFLPRRSLTGVAGMGFKEARLLYESILREEDDLGIRVVLSGAPEFPTALMEHISPDRLPALIYQRGRQIGEEAACVAMVGTRRPSPLGSDAAENFTSYFSQQNLRVVSGLAKGIDTIVHRSSLRSGAIAVLGGGLGAVYPRENQPLAEDILAQGGTLLSPFPLHQVPLPQNFPARNEFIAALTCGTIVIEGAEQSGAAITGMQALGMSKPVVTLSQDYRTDFGRGAIRLQQAGAILVSNEEEALQAIYASRGGFSHSSSPSRPGRIFSLSELQQISGKSLSEAVVLLEEGLLRGRIERLGPQRYRFVRPVRPK